MNARAATTEPFLNSIANSHPVHGPGPIFTRHQSMPPHLANAASESAFVIGTGAEASHEISQLAIIEDEQPAAPNIVKPNPDLDCVKPYAAKDGIRRMGRQMVKLSMGKGKTSEEVSVHGSLLLNQTRKFQRFLQPQWDTKTTFTIPIGNFRASTVELYKEWLYSHNIYSETPAADQAQDSEYIDLIEAYVMGAHFEDACFQNAVTNAMIEKIAAGHTLHVQMPSMVYARTTPGSALRKLLIDVYAWFGGAEWLDGSTESHSALHPEFLLDLCKTLFEMRDPNMKVTPPPFLQSACIYHDHSAVERVALRTCNQLSQNVAVDADGQSGSHDNAVLSTETSASKIQGGTRHPPRPTVEDGTVTPQ